MQAAALAGGLLVPLLTVSRGWPCAHSRRKVNVSQTARPSTAPRSGWTAVRPLVHRDAAAGGRALSGFALALTVASLAFRSMVSAQEALLSVMNELGGTEAQWLWHIVVSIAALVVAVVLARRGHETGALFLSILGRLGSERAAR